VYTTPVNTFLNFFLQMPIKSAKMVRNIIDNQHFKRYTENTDRTMLLKLF
jgi:hypothetical protein